MPRTAGQGSGSTTPAGVKSASRALSIFEYFEKARAPKSLSEIADDLDYPVSSTLALLRSIHAMGYLTYDHEARTYVPNVRFAMLGHWIHHEFLVGGVVTKLMEHLAATTGETILLSIQNGLQSQHVHIVQASQPLRYQPSVGTFRPLLRSAVGRVLLSRQDRAAVAKAVERINASGIDEGRTFDVRKVSRDLDAVLAAGFAYSANMFAQGAATVAVALPAWASDVPMAVCVGGPAARITEAAIPSILSHIHAAISMFQPAEEAGPPGNAAGERDPG